jgi:phosphohistidine phosphatase
MDLILWRHAEAEEADGEMSDLDRCLTRRGEKQATNRLSTLPMQSSTVTRAIAHFSTNDFGKLARFL